MVRPTHLRTASSSAPHLSYHEGRVVGSPKYYAVYWGGYWNTAAGQGERAYYDGFLHATASSLQFASIVLEYSTDDTNLTAGSFGSSAVDAHEPGASVGDNDCDEIVENQIDAGKFPKPDKNTVYVVFLPPGTQSTMFNGIAGKSCSDYCGYHTAQVVTEGNWILRYIVMPHHDSACPGCMYAAISNGTEQDIGRRSETITLSHEMAETQTDPDGAVLSFGWFDNSKLNEGEIGDLCEGTESQLGGYSVQNLWSNKQNACVAQGVVAGGSGGGCPADMHPEQGYCVPNNPVGCSSTGGGSAAGLAVIGLAVLALRRRR
jgi:MYXO-CTERM domain-containing protein